MPAASSAAGQPDGTPPRPPVAGPARGGLVSGTRPCGDVPAAVGSLGFPPVAVSVTSGCSSGGQLEARLGRFRALRGGAIIAATAPPDPAFAGRAVGAGAAGVRRGVGAFPGFPGALLAAGID